MNEKQSAPSKQANYHAYLLRLWRENSSGPWRAMLQDAATGQRYGFSGLAALWVYLRTQIGEHAPGSDGPALPSEHLQEKGTHD